MAAFIVGLLILGAGLFMFARLESLGDVPDEYIQSRHAEVRGELWGVMVVDLSREMILLHPMSDRAKGGRKARLYLDDLESAIVPWPEEEPDAGDVLEDSQESNDEDEEQTWP